MCLACTSKKCEFWHPHLRGTPIVVLPNFVKFYPFIFACCEKFYQSRVSGSVLNFGVFVWGGSLHFGTPKFCQIFILSSFCLFWIFHQSRKWLNFWVLASLFEVDSFILVPPNFVKFYLFLIFAYILKISCVLHEWLKSWNFGPRLRGTPILICPNFVKFYLFTFANVKIFMHLACVVRKFDFWRPHLRGTPFWYSKLLWILCFF